MVQEIPYRVLIDDLSPTQIERVERRMRPDSHDDPHFDGSVSGFLAPDEHLRDVITADLQTLDALGLKPEDIADRLDGIIGQARSILDQNPDRDGLSRAYRDVLRCAMCGRAIPVVEATRPSDPCPRCGGSFGVRREPLPGIRVHGRWMVTGYDCIVMGYQQCPFEGAEGTLCDWYHRPSGWRFGGQDLCITHLASGMALVVPRLTIHLIRAHHFFEGHVPYRLDPQRAAQVLELPSTRRTTSGTGHLPLRA